MNIKHCDYCSLPIHKELVEIQFTIHSMDALRKNEKYYKTGEGTSHNSIIGRETIEICRECKKTLDLLFDTFHKDQCAVLEDLKKILEKRCK